MYAIDLEYDGLKLSDFNFIICNFDVSNGVATVDAGSKLSFEMVSTRLGKKFINLGSKYDQCIQTTFDICKDPCKFDDLYITNKEYRKIARWLNRREFLKSRFIDDVHNNEPCYYNASFNIEELKVRDLLYGVRLTMTTDAPFGFGEEVTHRITFANTSTHFDLIDESDEIGITYPSVEILCNGLGDLTLTSEFNGGVLSKTTIKNCVSGELINIDNENQIIKSSKTIHDIANDFNYDFFKIENTYNNRLNTITTTLPCTLIIKYRPIIRDVL